MPAAGTWHCFFTNACVGANARTFAESDELLPSRSSAQPTTISGSSVVTVVQACKPRLSDDPTVRRRGNPVAGRVFAPSEMGSIVMIVGDVIGKETSQVSLVQSN